MKKVLLILSLALFTGQTALRAQEPAAPSPSPSPTPAAAVEQTETRKQPKYEVQLQFSQEKLTRGFGTWRSASLYVERKFARGLTLWGQYRASERRATRDQEIVAGAYKAFGRKWAATTEAMFSPTHQYVGKFSVMAEAERALGRGWVAHFGGRYTAYNQVKAATAYGLAEKYWGPHRAAYTLYVTRLTNAGTAPTHRLQYNRYWGENLNNLGASFAFGREHENLGPGVGILRSKTWSASLSGRFWLTKKIGLNVDALVHRQGDIYYRRGLNFGLRYRF